MKNQYKVTKKLYMSWALQNMSIGISLGMVIMWLVLTAILVVCAVFLKHWLYWAAAAYSLYRALVRPLLATSLQYERMAKIYGEKDWLRTIELTEDGILLYENTSSAAYTYSDIRKLTEKGNVVRLSLGRKGSVRLYKDAFVDCSWEECKEFIERNTIR